MIFTPLVIGLIGLAVLFILMFIDVPIGFAFAFVGFIGTIVIGGAGPAFKLMGTIPFNQVASYSFTVIPLFILMGEFAHIGGLTQDAYSVARSWLGRLPGGLAITTTAATTIFGACTGSGIATAVTMTNMAWPEMKRYKYSPSLGLGSICAASPIAVLIPPSLAFMIYAIIAEESVGRLFMAGVFPGLVLSLTIILTIVIIVKINPDSAPEAEKSTWKEKVLGLKRVWAILILILLVMGSIWGGVTTPNEAAGFGAFGAFIITLAKRRLSWQGLKDALRRSAVSGGGMFFMMVGIALFNVFMTLSQLPQALAHAVSGLPLPPLAIMGLILLTYVLLGFFLDAGPAIMLTLPLFLPVINSFGFDKVWFGVLVTIAAATGVMTPPVGLSVFAVHGLVKDEVQMYEIFKGTIPFLICFAVTVLICMFIPQIVLWLPGTMYGN